MMTLDEALAKVAGEIDAMIDRRLHKNAMMMVEVGLSNEDIADHLTIQRERVAAWRPGMLADLRQQLLEPW